MLLVGVNPLTKKLAMIVIINAHIYYFKNKALKIGMYFVLM